MNDLPKLSAALIIHEDGEVELMLPKLDDDAETPGNAMLIAALGILIRDPARQQTLVDEAFSLKPPYAH